MKTKKMSIAILVVILIVCTNVIPAFAGASKEPLQTYFSGDGKVMRIFTLQELDENASLLIGNENIPSTVVKSGVNIRTIFLIDNSTSMPWDLRDEIKKAIRSYISKMPKMESVKIATFDTETKILADEYSRDKEFIDFELSKVDFNGQASLVYDAVLKVAKSTPTNEDAYYRTVLITDGIDTVEGTSFDYLRTEISENGRYHIDVVQVTNNGNKDVNLKAISELGSNTYMQFKSGSNFEKLITGNVSMLKADMTNSVTTGEIKGVTIKNGDKDPISLGSILFPQVEIEEPSSEPESESEPEPEPSSATVSSEPTEISSALSEAKKHSGIPIIPIAAAAGGVVIITAIVLALVLSGKSCVVSVNITKDDVRDTQDIGPDEWRFPIKSEFRVGRTLKPSNSDNSALKENHKAICEKATNDDISSIGRNAFTLTYNMQKKSLLIKNTAMGAMFTVEKDGIKTDVVKGQVVTLDPGNKVLLGNYTTVTINNIQIK